MEKGATVVTNADVMNFYSDKREHYPYTDKFISKCEYGQQDGGGYITYYAKQTGRIKCKEFAEPNQKWHFLESYCKIKIEKEGKEWLEKKPLLGFLVAALSYCFGWLKQQE